MGKVFVFYGVGFLRVLKSRLVGGIFNVVTILFLTVFYFLCRLSPHLSPHTEDGCSIALLGQG